MTKYCKIDIVKCRTSAAIEKADNTHLIQTTGSTNLVTFIIATSCIYFSIICYLLMLWESHEVVALKTSLVCFYYSVLLIIKLMIIIIILAEMAIMLRGCQPQMR